MAIAFGVVLALFSVFILALPFVRSQRRGLQPPLPEPLEQTRQQRAALYEEIKTLRLDYELGHIDEGEYREQHHSLRLKAANLLRDEELFEKELGRLQQALEEEILAFRKSQGSREGGSRCLECGNIVASGAELCPQCKPGFRRRASEGQGEG